LPDIIFFFAKKIFKIKRWASWSDNPLYKNTGVDVVLQVAALPMFM
jgi:hypothetical protein